MKYHNHKWFLLVFGLIIVIAAVFNPDFITKTFILADYSIAIELLLHLPGFFILMGLFEVWLPDKLVTRHLGKKSGIKGSILCFLSGSVLPGPLYLAFPIASMLIKKKVSMFNVSLFIGAWSSFKIGEEIFELQFLGLKFLFLRLIISLPFVILLAYILSLLDYDKPQPQ